mgnify:CR=1 FL=1
MNPLVFLLLSTIPQEDVVRDRVDLIEVNHFYDEHGRLVFDQAIFYDWCDCHERHQVRAWRLVKCESQLPQRDWERGGYTVAWLDGEVLRRVRADSIRESWTQYDPEFVEREVLCKDKRRGLSREQHNERPAIANPFARPGE